MESAQSGTSNGALGGQLGGSALRDRTFHGSDPHTVAEAAICKVSSTKCQARTRLYRFIEGIGRWSNIDVFMLSILVALVQFGSLTRVEAEPGAVAFAGVVILTMLASRSFDARLMWDRLDAGSEAQA